MKNFRKKNKKKSKAGCPVAKILGKLLLMVFGLFLGTFILYFFNLENKLIYYVIYPLLNKHYDKQVRDRRI